MKEKTILDKKSIRKEILKLRDNLDLEKKECMDSVIESKFINSSQYIHAKNIFIYISYASEINTKNIIFKAINDGKKIYIPRTDAKTKNMDAVNIISFDKLVRNDYGILEPSKKELFIDPNELDLIVVPGVAFDIKKGRMGYGGGYYDRYFKKIDKKNFKKISKVALAYDFQIIDEVPMDENDMPVDYIITDTIEIN